MKRTFISSIMVDFEIREIFVSKYKYLNLLLIGDEQEDMIYRYLDYGRLFIGFINETPVSCCAITEEDDNTIEIKNLAVISEHRRQGIGRKMLDHVESIYNDKTFQLGTGETPSTLRFYKNCGYVFSHTIPGFFTNNYDHPIIEEGVTLNDMVYLKKKILKN